MSERRNDYQRHLNAANAYLSNGGDFAVEGLRQIVDKTNDLLHLNAKLPIEKTGFLGFGVHVCPAIGPQGVRVINEINQLAGRIRGHLAVKATEAPKVVYAETLSDDVVIKGARELCNRYARVTKKDADVAWSMHAHDFTSDARAMLLAMGVRLG